MSSLTETARPFPASPRSPLREYLVTVRDSVTYRHSAPGLTLDSVIDSEARDAAETFKDCEEGEFNDLLIWEGSRLAAAIRPRRGAAPEVIRFGPSASVDPLPDLAAAWSPDDQGEDEERIYSTRNPRIGLRSFVVATADYGLAMMTRVRLTLESVIADEIADYHDGRRAAAERGVSADAYAQGEDDRGIWEGATLVAIIKPRVGSDPLALIAAADAPTGFRVWVPGETREADHVA